MRISLRPKFSGSFCVSKTRSFSKKSRKPDFYIHHHDFYLQFQCLGGSFLSRLPPSPCPLFCCSLLLLLFFFVGVIGGLLYIIYIECDYVEMGRPKAKASSQQVRGLRQRKNQCLHANPDEENQLVLSQG